MDFPRQRLLARCALLVLAAGCAGWLLRLDYERKISTNVLDLIPAAEQAPEVALVRGFADSVQARVLLFALRDPQSPGAPPRAAAEAFAAKLREGAGGMEVVLLGGAEATTALGRAVFEHRLEWLLPGWLGAREREFRATGGAEDAFPGWLAERVAAELEAFLSRPEAAALQELIPQDPLLLVPRLAERAQFLTGGDSKSGYALVWARMRPSPFVEDGQGPVFEAIDLALARARAVVPGIELRWTGVNRFAAASRARIEAEIGWLNTFSIVAVLGVSCLLVRGVHRLLHLVPVIALSLAGAWTISTLVFDRLHILVFVIGSLLAGVAVDYGFYIYMQPSAGADETYAAKLQRLLKPLLASCLTTVIGFSILLFSDLPLLRQVGMFVSAGLLCALAAAMLYFAQLERPLLEGRTWAAGPRTARGRTRRAVRIGLGVLGLVAVAGPWWLQWRDDVRQLDLPAPELRENDAAVRALFGERPGRSVYLTHGATLAAARERLEAFLEHVTRVAPPAAAGGTGLLLPTESDWRALPQRLRTLETFPAMLVPALERRGFTGESFAPFLQAWRELPGRVTEDYAGLAAGVRSALTGPLGLLSHTEGEPFWFLTIVDGPLPPLPAELQTLGLNQLQSLNELFARYRWSALRLSLAGLGLVIVSVFAIYPWRPGLRIALIPAGSCFFVFGLLGLTGQPLNLFHLLGAFLGLCLSHNYAIFSAPSSAARSAPPVPVRLSALCTAASFGVLGCSRIPVIHALGVTVALIVLTALLVVELEPFARGEPA